MQKLFTIRQAAAFLGVAQAEVEAMIRNGQLPAWRLPLGKELLIRGSDLLARIHENPQPGQGAT